MTALLACATSDSENIAVAIIGVGGFILTGFIVWYMNR